VSSSWPDRLGLRVTCGDKTFKIQTRFVGEHWTASVLAAITCGIVCGLDLNDCVKAVENFEPIFGRHSVHVKPDGPVYVFDHKAPFWTIVVGLAFVKGASAPRKTVVFGTISDYPGAASRRYRRVARDALEVADRVVFVGPNSRHVNKLKGDSRERLFAFVTTYQASAFLAATAIAGELVYIKGSIGADHLERIMLSQLDRVVCWRERCGIELACIDCAHNRTPFLPPLGSDDDSFKPARTHDLFIDGMEQTIVRESV
jgi:UDP-N-acetylmuramoyl-tripeptide--D-alanyl-D-alanine ligase